MIRFNENTFRQFFLSEKAIQIYQESALSFKLSCHAILSSKFANMPLKCCIHSLRIWELIEEQTYCFPIDFQSNILWPKIVFTKSLWIHYVNFVKTLEIWW